MSESLAINSHQNNHYHDLPKGASSKVVRVVLAVIAAALLGGVIFMWVANAKGMFHFDSFIDAKGFLEFFAAGVGTVGALVAAGYGARFALAEPESYSWEPNFTDIEMIRMRCGAYSLKELRNTLCRNQVALVIGVGDVMTRQKVYTRNVSLARYVYEGKLTVDEVQLIDRWLETANTLLREIENIDEEIDQLESYWNQIEQQGPVERYKSEKPKYEKELRELKAKKSDLEMSYDKPCKPEFPY